MSLKQRRYMMGVVMFLMLLVPGMWVPSLPNILETYEARWVLPFATALGPFCAMCSALVFGALSDRKVNAERLLGVLGVSGALFLWLGFSALEWGWHPVWYLVFQGVNALISGPMLALMTKVKLANLPNATRSFPIYAMCGTIGWMSGGLLVSWLGFDQVADAGRLGAFFRLVMGSLCFLMPATPPADEPVKGWKAALGLTAFGLLRERELRVFYVASALFAVPCVSFLMLVPVMLKDFGSGYPTAQMTFGQVSEILAMLFLSAVGGRYRVRWFVIIGLSLGILRFASFAVAGELGTMAIIWFGIALHGPIFTFTTVAGRLFLDKRVPDTMRGQAQALFQFLIASVAGVVGAFVCGWLYQRGVDGSPESWAFFWWLLVVWSVLPLVYFTSGVLRRE